MRLLVHRLLRQPLVGAVALTVAVAVLSDLWISAPRSGSQFSILLPLAILLSGALCAADLFPIHIHQNTKILMGSVVLYLLAVLLPPQLAGTAALGGLLFSGVLARAERGLYASDIATQVGRGTTLVVLNSLLAHALSLPGIFHEFTLVAVAATFWAGDFLTAPLVVTPITGEAPRTVIINVVSQAGATEAGQYLIAMLGAIAAQTALWSLLLLTLPMAMMYLTSKRNNELQNTTQLLLERMADTVDLRDPYTGGHSRRVTDYTKGILRELGVQGPDVSLIVVAARVHDIGKIGIPDHILLKDGALTDEERAIMAQHPEHGADLLAHYPDFRRGVEIVRHHHESWDGSGYPHRLRERDIPFGARVIAVADSYDAMTSDRPYRAGMSPDKAAAILR